MNPAKLSLTLAITAVLTLVPRLQAADDWFSQNGFTILESVGIPELGFVLVGQDESGSFHLLKKGDTFRDRFTVEEIGSEQVRVVTPDKQAQVSLILHRNIPSDILLMSIGVLHQRGVVLGSRSEELKAFSPDLLMDPARLAEFCREEGLDVRVFQDALLVKKGAFPEDLQPYAPGMEEDPVEIRAIRGTVGAVCAAATKGSPFNVTATSGADLTATVIAGTLSAPALTYYLSAVTGAKIETAPKAAPKAEVKPAVEAKPAVKTASADEKKHFARARKLLAAGKYAPAFKIFRALSKKFGPRPAYYNGMGLALWKLGRRTVAVKAWNKSLALDPKNVFATRYLHRVKEIGAAPKAAPSAS